MPNFKCEKCGNGSLVRSNFRLTKDGRAYCRRFECTKAWESEVFNHAVGDATQIVDDAVVFARTGGTGG